MKNHFFYWIKYATNNTEINFNLRNTIDLIKKTLLLLIIEYFCI
jgi:hypothetical protein